MLLLGLGQPLRELFGIAGRDQLILGGVATRRHCPVVAGRAATPDRPSRVQAPQLLESDVLAGSASCGAHPGGRQAANVAGNFDAGDAVVVVDGGGPIGKGISNYSAAELRRVKGLKSGEVREVLPLDDSTSAVLGYLLGGGVIAS